MRGDRVDIGTVRRHFSSHAREYDLHAVVQKRVASRLVELIGESGVGPGPALDVGTGTGDLARRLLRSCPGLDLVISDLSHGMTCHAAAALAGSAAVDADAQALPFRTGSFSLLLSASVYQWVNDLPGAFAEGSRVLAPGGRFAFALFGDGTLKELKEAHRLALAETGGRRVSHVQEFPGLAEVRRAMGTAGFSSIHAFAEDEVESHRDVPSLLRCLKGIGAANASAHRPPGLAPRRVISRMMALYAERYARDGRIPATYRVIYGLASKPGGALLRGS